MGTAVELPDERLTAAKKRAAELRVPLWRLLEEGLRARLGKPASCRPGRRIRWVIVGGGLPPDLERSSRELLYERLRSGRS
ncbi:MAG: hypothetical protein HY907_08670 [Deltaproteobacteria bacterium]|nr:hypothetical protein [Deltaproteobacteria bacterium]